MQEAPSAGMALLRMMVRNHENYKYWFIRPSVEEVVKRYNTHHHPKLGTAGDAAGRELAAEEVPAVEATPAAATPAGEAAGPGVEATAAVLVAAAHAAREAALKAGANREVADAAMLAAMGV